ncbi:MAG: TlpA family protein disulfide reductase [Actinomycetota bacterium]|nr:TlpA family protein disulfide reductase [Actinomycetota bacterium]
MTRTTLLRFLLGLFLLALTACGGKALGSETAGRSIQTEYGYNVRVIPAGERRTGPSFGGGTLDGARLSSASYRGSVVVVNFWASDCGPCRKEEPILESVWKKYQGRAVVFVGIDTDRSNVNGKAFVKEFGVTYPSIFDPYFEIAYKFHVSFLPATYVLDPQGRIAAIIFGAAAHEKQLVGLLDKELA